MRIGAHIHTGGGLVKAAAYARDTGCECVQIFAKSPQMWHGPRRDPEEAVAFVTAMRESGIGPVFTHASYLINAGSTDEDQVEKSRAALADELVRGAQVGAEGVVLHMGTAGGPDASTNAARVADSIAGAFRSAAAACEPPRLLLENAAGAGRSFGRDVGELCVALTACIARGVNAGLCVDTCHGFAAGWDLRDAPGWSRLCDELSACGALGAVALVHANDCKSGLGAHRDRHEWIGDGLIGAGGFLAMFRERRLEGVPVVCEMPGEPPEKDRENVARLRALRDAAGALADPSQGGAGFAPR